MPSKNKKYRFQMPAVDKALCYRLFKNLMEIHKFDFQAKKEMVKLILRFTPGNDTLYLKDLERQVIVSWLIKIEAQARLREKMGLAYRLSKIIETLCT